MNKKFNRLLAAMLAGTMVLGMSTTVFAEDPAGSGGGTGAGELEGHVDKNVLAVTLPTDSDTTTFKYTIDPEGLIAATQAAKYPGTTYNSSTGVYFQTSDKNYTDKSAKLKVTNKGNVDADVTVNVSVADSTGITAMKAKDGFTAAGATELYMGLLVNDDAGIAVGGFADAGKATKTVGLKGRESNFEVKYNSTASKYEYAIKDGVADTAWNSFEFGLEGACNTKGNYSADNFAVPTVTVTWSYVEHPETGGATMLPENAVDKAPDVAPSIQTEAYNYERDSALEIAVNFGSGDLKATSIEKVEGSNDGEVITSDFTSACTISENKITFPAGKFGGAQVNDTRYLVVTFDNGKTANASLKIAK